MGLWAQTADCGRVEGQQEGMSSPELAQLGLVRA
jgi:hypothetical protein